MENTRQRFVHAYNFAFMIIICLQEVDPNENELILCVRDIHEGFALKHEDLDRMRTIDRYST